MTKNWPQGYKTFFMLSSTKHEILNAHKYKNIKKLSFFISDTDKPRLLFLLAMLKCQQLSELENDSESVWAKIFANKPSYYIDRSIASLVASTVP